MTHLVSFPKLGIEITTHEQAFAIGSLSVRWYGILIGLGFLLAVLYGFRCAKKMDIDGDKLIDVIIWGIIGGVIGARLYYVIFYAGDFFTGATFMENFLKIFKIYEGGLGFYGGLIGALVAGGITAKVKKMNIPALFDQIALGFLIGQAIGRWGNFMNQEAFGAPTDLPWGMVSDNTGGVPVHPCFLYESLLCVAGFILLHFFTRRLRRYDGQTFLLYIIWYGTSRFFIEYLRTDSLVIANSGFKVSMVVAALCVLGGIICLFVFRRRTVLSGYGSKKVMEANGIDPITCQKIETPAEEMEETEKAKEDRQSDKEEYSTIFGDLDIEEEPKAKAAETKAETEKTPVENAGETEAAEETKKE